MHRPLIALVGALTVAAPLAACTDNNTSAGTSGPITVTSTNNECRLSRTNAPSGNLVFEIENKGSKVTEFYLFEKDGLAIVGEVENIGPGATRKLVIQAPEGLYVTACKPGMTGDGIRGTFEVTKGEKVAVSADIAHLISTATNQYALYVKDQTEQLIAGTKEFVAAVKSGDDAKARELYPSVRMHWERIEPVAESFGTLDPKLDLREADLEAGQTWTGWHRLEKELWPPATGYTPMTSAERAQVADQLLTDTLSLGKLVEKKTYKAQDLSNGARELLDEVAAGKVTGEEEIWSHTDLWDFQANLDGARVAFTNLRPALELKNKALATRLEQRFTALQTLLDRYKVGDGWRPYDELTKAQVKELSDSVNALSEPLSEMTAALVSK